MSKPLRSLAVALVAAVVGAPLAGPLGSISQHCVAACPMHRQIKCHGSHVGTASATSSSPHCGTVAIAAPGCTCQHELPTWTTARALVHAAFVAWTLPLHPAIPDDAPRSYVRAADPPESPPPIRTA